MLFCLGPSDTAEESLGKSVSRVKQRQAPLHTQTIAFLVLGRFCVSKCVYVHMQEHLCLKSV